MQNNLENTAKVGLVKPLYFAVECIKVNALLIARKKEFLCSRKFEFV